MADVLHFGDDPDEIPGDEAIEIEDQLQEAMIPVEVQAELALGEDGITDRTAIGMKRALDKELKASEAGMPTARSLANVKMASFGYSFVEISSRLGYANPRAAQRAFIAAVAATHSPEDNATMRMKQSMRLERLLLSVMPTAVKVGSVDQLAYNRRANEIIDDISKLHGVNAPTQLQFTNPDAEKFESVIGQLHAVLHGAAPEEGDFLELTEGKDGVMEGPDAFE